VKITDFGIAKATMKKSFTSTGMLKGKFSYMSPEQVRGETLSPQSDLFSLGVVLYEMVTGQKCFDGDTEISIIDKIRNAQIKVENLPPSIPDSLKKIIAKSLAADLSERYPSADQVQTELAHALAELHPGFLPKDLSQFMKEFNPSPGLAAGASSGEAGVSPSAETNISYSGFKAATQSGVEKEISRFGCDPSRGAFHHRNGGRRCGLGLCDSTQNCRTFKTRSHTHSAGDSSRASRCGDTASAIGPSDTSRGSACGKPNGETHRIDGGRSLQHARFTACRSGIAGGDPADRGHSTCSRKSEAHRKPGGHSSRGLGPGLCEQHAPRRRYLSR
jgi:serine/threonine protein kinase